MTPRSRATASDEDRAFRGEVLAWLATRYGVASTTFRDTQWASFREFADLWIEQLDWSTERQLGEFLALPSDVRRERAERFRRHASSWDVTLRFPHDAAASESARRAEWRDEFQRRRRVLESRAAADADRWARVQRLLDAEAGRRDVPDRLRDAWALLELPGRATLSEARRSFRELARRHHPDADGSHVEMKALNEAWRRVAAFFVGRG